MENPLFWNRFSFKHLEEKKKGKNKNDETSPNDVYRFNLLVGWVLS